MPVFCTAIAVPSLAKRWRRTCRVLNRIPKGQTVVYPLDNPIKKIRIWWCFTAIWLAPARLLKFPAKKACTSTGAPAFSTAKKAPWTESWMELSLRAMSS
jgi:hypothetical protein